MLAASKAPVYSMMRVSTFDERKSDIAPAKQYPVPGILTKSTDEGRTSCMMLFTLKALY